MKKSNTDSTPTTTNPLFSNLPIQPFDNIRLLAANQNILFALGCYDANTSFNINKNSISAK